MASDFFPTKRQSPVLGSPLRPQLHLGRIQSPTTFLNGHSGPLSSTAVLGGPNDSTTAPENTRRPLAVLDGFSHDDLSLSYSGPRWPEQLHGGLQFSSTAPAAATSTIPQRPPDSSTATAASKLHSSPWPSSTASPSRHVLPQRPTTVTPKSRAASLVFNDRAAHFKRLPLAGRRRRPASAGPVPQWPGYLSSTTSVHLQQIISQRPRLPTQRQEVEIGSRSGVTMIPFRWPPTPIPGFQGRLSTPRVAPTRIIPASSLVISGSTRVLFRPSLCLPCSPLRPASQLPFFHRQSQHQSYL